MTFATLFPLSGYAESWFFRPGWRNLVVPRKEIKKKDLPPYSYMPTVM